MCVCKVILFFVDKCEYKGKISVNAKNIYI